MLNAPLFYCIIAAFFFGTWPLVARGGGVPVAWIALLISMGTAVIGLTPIISGGGTAISRQQLIFGIIAGILNGLGMIAYAKLIGWQGMNLSKIVPLATAMMPLVTVIGAMLFFGEVIDVRKGVGIGLAVVAVYLLN